MKAGESNKQTRPPRSVQTTAHSVAEQWLSRESQRLENLRVVGDSHKISVEQATFAKALGKLLDEHDKLLKYCRLVVLQHEKEGFEYNVNAIRSYLLEDLSIEI